MLAFAASILLAQLQGPSARLAQIESIARSGSMETVRLLVPLLTDQDPALRLPAARAIREVRKRFQAEVARTMKTFDAMSPADARIGLARCQSRAAVWQRLSVYPDSFSPELLVRVANDRVASLPIRRRLIADLASRAFEADHDYQVNEAYRRFGPEIIAPESRFVQELCQQNPAIAISLSADPHYRFRRAMVLCLTGLNSPEVTAALVDRTVDRWSSVREAAVLALVGRPGPEVRHVVEVAAKDKYAFVRLAAKIAEENASQPAR